MMLPKEPDDEEEAKKTNKTSVKSSQIAHGKVFQAFNKMFRLTKKCMAAGMAVPRIP